MLVSDASGSDLGGEYRAHGLDKQVYTFWELETPQRSERFESLKSGFVVAAGIEQLDFGAQNLWYH